MDTATVVSVKNAAHYQWGQNSDGWHLLKNEVLSVIEESMLPGSSEHLHYHQQAQQLFYVLSGKASFIVSEREFSLVAGESIHIAASTPHRIVNTGDAELRFLTI